MSLHLFGTKFVRLEYIHVDNFIDIPFKFFLHLFFSFLMFSLIFTNMHIRFVYPTTVLKHYDSTFI